MFGIILALGILFFGFFLKTTSNPGFANSKKFSWMFIAIGILTVIGKIVIMFQKGEF